ncbi:hypothetical protein F5887DRAFT_502507 [Amanita rubescens]|nr:hypothetical protein F5887DRAFT_502507 [Amanita rubescens]
MSSPVTITIKDEWTLLISARLDLGQEMEDNYKSFTTGQDGIAQNQQLRVSIGLGYQQGFWAVEIISDGPFLSGTSWRCLLKTIE